MQKHNLKLCVWLVGVALMVAGCGLYEAVMGFSVSGIVVDEDDNPLVGVEITVSGNASKSITTEADGTWSFEDLYGVNTIKAAKEGWTFAPSSVTRYSSVEGIIFVGQVRQVDPVELTASNASGGFEGSIDVELECNREGYTIYFTTDNTMPTTGSQVYSAPISIDSTTVLKALAINDQDPSDTSDLLERIYIKDALIWLDAAAGDAVQLDGDNRVVQLLDKSGNDYHAAGVGTLPLYVEDAINGKPAFRFEDRTNGFWSDYNMGAFANITIYIVHQRLADVVDDSQHGRLLSAAPDPEKDVWVAPNYHVQPANHQNAIPYDALLQRFGRSGIEGGPIAIAMDAVHYARWNAFGSGGYVGDIAEVIIVGRNVAADTAENDLIIQLLTDKWGL